MLRSDLPKQRRAFSAALASGDMDALRKQSHSLSGLAAYCCTPALKAAVSDLQEALHGGGPNAISTPASGVLREIDRLLTSSLAPAAEDSSPAH